MWARTGIEFMKLCSCHGTLNPDFHHNSATSEPKNKTVDGVRRIHENTGLRIILGWILKQLHETGHSSLQPYNGFKSLENSHSKII